MADPYAPHLPEVDQHPDLPRVFAEARAEGARRRSVAVVTPGRMIMFLPAPDAGSVAAQFVAQAKVLLPSTAPLKVTAVASTDLKPLMEDKERAMPMLGQLLGLVYVGHSVVVFEGHPSAYAAGIAGAEALIVDSGMLPLLQPDWLDLARAAIPAPGRILAHERAATRLLPLVKSKQAPGWRYTEPDGAASYLNCLLMVLAKREPVTVEIVPGQPAPDLTALAQDPAQIEWTRDLPFRYDALNIEMAIALINRFAKWTGDSALLKTQVPLPDGGRQDVLFRVSRSGNRVAIARA